MKQGDEINLTLSATLHGSIDVMLKLMFHVIEISAIDSVHRIALTPAIGNILKR